MVEVSRLSSRLGARRHRRFPKPELRAKHFSTHERLFFSEPLATALHGSNTDGKQQVALGSAAPLCGYDFGNHFCSLFLLCEICVICGAIWSPNSKNKFLKHSKKLNRKVFSKPSGSSPVRRLRTLRSLAANVCSTCAQIIISVSPIIPHSSPLQKKHSTRTVSAWRASALFAARRTSTRSSKPRSRNFSARKIQFFIRPASTPMADSLKRCLPTKML